MTRNRFKKIECKNCGYFVGNARNEAKIVIRCVCNDIARRTQHDEWRKRVKVNHS